MSGIDIPSGGRITQVDLTARDGSTASYVFTYPPTLIERQRLWPANRAPQEATENVDPLTHRSTSSGGSANPATSRRLGAPLPHRDGHGDSQRPAWVPSQ